MRRVRGLGFQLAFSHGIVALLGCAFLALLLAWLLPAVYVHEREESLIEKARDLADDVAVWLAGAEEQPDVTIARVEAAGVKVVDIDQQVQAFSVTRRRWVRGHRTAAALNPAVGPRTPIVDRWWKRRWRSIVAGRVVRGTLTLADGRSLVVAAPARYKGETVGAVIVTAQLADLHGAEDALLPVIAGAALAATLAAIAAGIGLARRMARPLERMTRAAERVAGGDLEVQVAPPSWREGESLALAFNRMTRALAVQEKARRQFIADASHQLRAPLTSLQAQTEALLDDVIADEATRRSFVARIAEEIRSFAALSQQLLDLERLDATEIAPRRDAIDVAALLTSVADAFRAGERVKIEVAAEAGLPQATGDPQEVRQALINLLDNALRYSPAGKSVRLWARAEGGGVRVGVTDEGAGIAPEHLARVWDRFYRAPGDATGGSGLGLAIARRLIERQAGAVSAESALGAGSTFSFTLPCAKD